MKLPTGMEAFYIRMASTINDLKLAKDKTLAISILQCVLTSLRLLTLAELARALQGDDLQVLDVHKAVSDLCAGFVVVDNDGNVAILHQTAREYLLQNEQHTILAVDEEAAHECMFLACIRTLMAPGLRSMIKSRQIPDFYDYAAVSWSTHLAESSSTSEPVTNALSKFLDGQRVLTWIHYLSKANRLGVLVQTSRNLAVFFGKQKRSSDGSDLTGAYLLKQSLHEGWTTDLIQVVGKFGMTLRTDPESIYKLITPFCPTTTSLWQTFGRSEARVLSITGLDSDRWDDAIARITLETDSFATSLASASGIIAILASTGPSLKAFLYDATSFEPLPMDPITHGERVQRMELNNTGTLLATYGYRTTRIWSIPDGICQTVVDNENGRRPLAMMFVSDGLELLVGTDDRRLISVDLSQDKPSWQIVVAFEEDEMQGLHLNAASFMAINGDASLVAVASRGHPASAWETAGPTLIRHCWRTRVQNTFGQVIDATWHPHNPELFGLYYDGVLFRWRPDRDECEELIVRASKLTISRDGNLLATGDGRGTVKVFTTVDLGLIYQLAAEDTVLGLTFSPDLRRLYDIRGRHANVWEPIALMKFAEQRERGADGTSETESITAFSTLSAMTTPRRVDSISVLAACPTGRFYAYGTDQGLVYLCDVWTERRAIIYAAKSFFSIEQMAWSDGGEYFAFSFSGKRAIVMSVALSNDTAEHSQSSTKIHLDTVVKTKEMNVSIMQLLFDGTSSRLAIACASLVQILHLEKPEATEVRTLDSTSPTRWVNHPNDQGLLVGVSAKALFTMDWCIPTDQSSRIFSVPLFMETADESSKAHVNSGTATIPTGTTTANDTTVARVIVSPGRQKAIMQLRAAHHKSGQNVYFSLDLATLRHSPAQMYGTSSTKAANLDAVTVARCFDDEIANDTGRVLGFLPRDRLVVLSRKFAVQTMQSPSVLTFHGARKPSTSLTSRPTSISPALGPPSLTRPPTAKHLALPESSSGLSLKPKSPDLGSYNTLGACTGSSRPMLGSPGPRPQTLSQRLRAGSGDSVAKASTTAAISPTSKTLFYLPGDWIGHEGVSLCLFWPKEKAFLCPRSGEVAMVRSAGLA